MTKVQRKLRKVLIILSLLSWPAVDLPKAATQCSQANEYSISKYPVKLDFGTQAVGEAMTLRQAIFANSKNCTPPSLEENPIELTDEEFSLQKKECYTGVWEDENYSTCLLSVAFLPTSKGPKEAKLTIPEIATVPIQAQALVGKPQMEISPTHLDFKTAIVGSSHPPLSVVIHNTSRVNLKLDELALEEPSAFKLNSWECLVPWLLPGKRCQAAVQFVPLLAGEETNRLTIASGASSAAEITLQGTAKDSQLCSEVTIESVNSGAWGMGETWSTGALPTPEDVVRVSRGHILTALPKVVVKTLCIEEGATLESADNLWLQATDYLENQGTLRGQEGASIFLVTGPTVTDDGREWGYYGAGRPIVNRGTIIAGGAEATYAASGGSIVMLGRNVLNTGLIQGGEGGVAGQGGRVQMVGNLGGAGYLYNAGEIRGGQGGRCNLEATGGEGGSLRLLALPEIYLHGVQAAGKGGEGCSSSQQGDVMIDPSMISWAPTGSQIEGRHITIFGGEEWSLNLNHLESTVIKATGNVTLAVGETGHIDLRGNARSLLEATGQVTLLANEILLDEGETLTDLMTASQLVVGPSKVLREVVLLAPEPKVTGLPGETITLEFILINSGPEKDTYALEVSDMAGWPLSQFTSPVIVEGLYVMGLRLKVTLHEESNFIKVTAISQTNPKVTSTAEVRVEVPDLTLPYLGVGVVQGLETASKFRGGIAVNGQEPFLVEQVVKRPTDSIDIRGLITADPVGQLADLVVYFTYQATPLEKGTTLMLGPQGEILAWDGQADSLVVFREQVELTSQVNIYQGKLLVPGIVNIYLGYRLPTGEVVSHQKPMILTVTD